MTYAVGVDLGTSAVKVLLVTRDGEIKDEVSRPLSLSQPKSGWSEQDPEEWVTQTIDALKELTDRADEEIGGLSFSGQMHGLVLLDEHHKVLRPAILWNDTRTTKQCRDIYDQVGEEKLLSVTKNPALEGFTLPKILWVKEEEPENFGRAATFVLPKDYLRYRLTGKLAMEYSDAAGTLLLDIEKKTWSSDICEAVGLPVSFCPPLVASTDQTGTITEERTGLTNETKVFAGGADNACGAVGAGILSEGKTLCSIGTSGVVLSYEADAYKDFGGDAHYFYHAAPEALYTMGVTLAAGDSLRWFKDVFAEGEDFDEFVKEVGEVPAGSRGLLFTPYIQGERTPHADADIRGSFIGMDASHRRKDFVRAVMEGITFSLNESIEMFRKSGKNIDTIVSIGGGAKNEEWLQMQADVFDATVVKLRSEQGPGMGAAMIAAYGCGWFISLESCAAEFLEEAERFEPDQDRVETYRHLFCIYQKVYRQTKGMNEELKTFRG
ncbi:xylulokinase [Salimicrobium halophilum]|uniref:Xylulose kinase n=1 Tax=Salimicrobium halophilum TaxID=86666 RepID=A0A1G8S7M3_9BACI|nr:xylulokinase [Salimicrobium halophilum]SDJ25161.1 xylulokinase [Salimicrobium halophilum]